MIHLAVAAILYLNMFIASYTFRLVLLYCRENASVIFR